MFVWKWVSAAAGLAVFDLTKMHCAQHLLELNMKNQFQSL